MFILQFTKHLKLQIVGVKEHGGGYVVRKTAPPFHGELKILYYELIHVYICDRILENGSKSHIFITVYLSLQHEKYCIPNNISWNSMLKLLQ